MLYGSFSYPLHYYLVVRYFINLWFRWEVVYYLRLLLSYIAVGNSVGSGNKALTRGALPSLQCNVSALETQTRLASVLSFSHFVIKGYRVRQRVTSYGHSHPVLYAFV
jgi:hypothetical protein